MQKTNLHLHSKYQQNILILKKIKPFKKSKMAALKIQNQQFRAIIQFMANRLWKPIIRPCNYCRSIKGPVVFDFYLKLINLVIKVNSMSIQFVIVSKSDLAHSKMNNYSIIRAISSS